MVKKIIYRLLIVIIIIFFGMYIVDFCKPIIENLTTVDPKIQQLKDHLNDLHYGIKDLNIYKGNKSYTINKKKIYICLKDKNNTYYPDNHLVYVLLHEFAHCLNNEIGHTPKFYKIFHNLLEEAHDRNLYDKNIPPIENYCGHD